MSSRAERSVVERSLSQNQQYDVIIIGAGAAGLMCAMEAGKRGRKVVVLEHAARVGQKIEISGGGRCNFTNINAGPDHYISGHPDFCRSALARYTPQDFLDWVEKHGIRYHEKKLGQQFCNFSSKQIIQLLLKECKMANVEIRLNCRIQSVQKKSNFLIETNQGLFSSDSLVIATGGLSFPKIGATGFGHEVARQFGLKVTDLKPALVPLTFIPEDRNRYRNLSGVSLPVTVRYQKKEFTENLLITHHGFSGPAILQISSYWKEGDPIEIDLLPELKADEWLASHHSQKMELITLLSQKMPRRFVQAWCQWHALSQPLYRYKLGELREIGRRLNHWQVRLAGREGYDKAEVTLGGVDTKELSSKTMEARRVPGLYFVGEVVDVTGWLGGYNFQWAWASGYAAGQFV